MRDLLKTRLSVLPFILIILLGISSEFYAKLIIVDKTGLGEYTTIQAGINAALPSDTVKVFPGIYNEQVNVGKNVVLQGSGYEYTRIVANSDPALSMSEGKVMWFAISSNVGSGVGISGGILTNCVVWNCAEYGISYNGKSAIIQNCNIINNNSYGINLTTTENFSVINSILFSFTNFSYGDNISKPTFSDVNALYCRFEYSSNNIGCIDSSPHFSSDADFKINSSSPCWDTGKPDIYDPDGSRSDMGYYGGPDAPIHPVVTDLRIYLNPDGTVNIQATAQSTY